MPSVSCVPKTAPSRFLRGCGVSEYDLHDDVGQQVTHSLYPIVVFVVEPFRLITNIKARNCTVWSVTGYYGRARDNHTGITAHAK